MRLLVLLLLAFATVTYGSSAARQLRDGAAAAGWPSAIAEAYEAFRLLV